MSTTSITSGTYFVGKTLIIGSTGLLYSNPNYARIFDFHIGSTSQYIIVPFAGSRSYLRFTAKPFNAGEITQEYYHPTINTYYIYVISFVSNIQLKVNIYVYNDSTSTINTTNSVVKIIDMPNTALPGLNNFWLGRSIYPNDDFYNGRYDKVALYNGDLFALSDANILSNLLTLVTSPRTNIINNSTYTFRSLGTNFLGVVVDILNFNTTTGSTVTTSNITLIGTGSTSGGYLNIIGSYTEPVPYSLNTPNKQWLMYLNTLSSISSDDLTIKPDNARNLLLEVSANNSIFMKKGTTLYNLTNLITGDVSFSNIDVSQNLNPLLPNNSSLGISGKMWGNAYIKDISLINMSISGSFSNVRQIIPQNDISTSLGNSLNMWQKAFIRDLSGITSINGSNWPIIGPTGPTGPTGATGPIGPELRVNINRRLTDISNFRLTTKSRIYQNISGSFNDPIWNAVNGYYGLAKDAYPGLNPLSSGVKAVNTWTIRTAPQSNEWSSICWSPELGLFVAVSWYGINQVMTSSNGIDWIPQSQTASSYFWTSVCWSPKLRLFVAICTVGIRVMTSPDGINWTPRTGAQNNTWTSVCWSPELEIFVAVSENGGNRVMTSLNGTTWNPQSQGIDANIWKFVCWSPELGLFVAVAESGDNRVMTSPNGINWTARPAAQKNLWSSVCWSPQLGIFVAVSRNATNCVMYSSNGIVWTSIAILNNVNNWMSVCWCAQLELFVAVASNGYIMYSSNGITWTITTSTLINSINRTTTLTNLLTINNGTSGFAINSDLAQDALIAVIGSTNPEEFQGTRGAGNIFVQDVSGITITQNLITLTGASQASSQRLGRYVTITNDGEFIVGSTELNGKLHLWKKNSGATLGYTYFNSFTMTDQTSATLVRVKLTKNSILDVPYEMLLAVGICVGATGNIGRARVYSINKTSGVFSLVQELTDNTNVFAQGIGISPNGVTLVIQSGNICGIYTFNYTTSQYTLIQTITGQVATTGPSPPNPPWDDYPGANGVISFASSSKIMALGSYVSSFGPGTQVGYVDIYNNISNKWIFYQRIEGTANQQYFGWSVGFDATGSSLIIGDGGNPPDMYVYRKFTDSSYVQVSTYDAPNIENATSVGLSADGTRYIVSSGHRQATSGRFYCGNVITQGIGLNSICWSPELGIFAAVAISSATANNRIITSSLKGRPPTSTNVFDSSFNRIDENGNWTFQTMAVTTMTVGGSFVTSDDRLKHNEVIITNGLAVIDKLTPKFYQKTQVLLDASYNGDLTAYTWSLESGLIAQEVLQISDISYLVGGGDYYEPKYIYKRQANDLSYNYYETSANYFELSNNYFEPRANNYEVSYNLITQAYNLNYNSVFVYGVAAIKELHTKVKAQETTILDEQLNDLVTRIEALEHNISS